MGVCGVCKFVAVIVVGLSVAGVARSAELPLNDCTKLQNILTSGRSAAVLRMKSEWTELNAFHQELWRSMALDPGIVPVAKVPEGLQSKNLNEKLEKKFEELSTSALIQKYGIEQPFAEYVDVVSQILALRRDQKFINARAIAKRGLLDNAYHALVAALNDAQQADEGILLPVMSNDTEKKLKEVLQQISLVAQSQAKPAPVVIAKAPQVLEAAPTQNTSQPSPRSVVLGFILGLPFGGLIVYLFTSKKSPAQIEAKTALASVHPITVPPFNEAKPQSQLKSGNFDFAQWLRDFRELVGQYRKLRSENESTLNEVQPFLGDAAKLYRKYYQETRESHYRGQFTDLELATGELIGSLSELLNHSDAQCQAMIRHLAVLAEAIQSENFTKSA